jgi:hypothetical protein
MVLASTFTPSVNPDSISSTFWMLGSPVYWLLGAPPISMTSIPRPTYHYGLPIYGLITIILYLLATQLVKPARRWRVKWADVILALVLLLGFLGVVGLGYLATTNRYENIRIISPATPTPFPALLPESPTEMPEATPENGVYPSPENPYPAAKGNSIPSQETGFQHPYERITS